MQELGHTFNYLQLLSLLYVPLLNFKLLINYYDFGYCFALDLTFTVVLTCVQFLGIFVFQKFKLSD